MDADEILKVENMLDEDRRKTVRDNCPTNLN